MKKIIIICAFGLYLSMIVKGQTNIYHPFPNSDAIWTEITTRKQPYSFSTNQYLMLGDTTINYTIYHKLYQKSFTYYDSIITKDNSTLIGAILEDSLRRIYFYPFNSYPYIQANRNYKIYDFSKQMIGDTINFSDTIPYSNLTTNLVINSVDSVLVYNSYRKRFHFLYGEQWIEGIGSSRCLFSSITPHPTCICYIESICFKQNENTYYMNPIYDDCYPTVSYILFNIQEYSKSEIKIFPNPTNDIINIESQNPILEIIISNIFGVEIKKLIGNINTINISEFSNGIYFIKIKTKETTIVQKIIKER